MTTKPDRFSAPVMLESYRKNATPFLRQQIRDFRALAPTDQRELLFYMIANMAVSHAVTRMLAEIEPQERPSVQ
jgi:hypothetical protein